MVKNKIIRVSEDFDSEIENIQDKRIEKGLDEEKTSKPKISDLIRKHKLWNQLKEDVINFDFNLQNVKK